MASFAEIHKNTTVTSYSSMMTTFKEGSTDKNSTDLQEVLKTERRKYFRNKILYECLQSCVSSLGSELGGKLEDICRDVEVQQYISLGNHNLLGITSERTELTYQEGDKLKLVLQRKMREQRTQLFEEFKKITLKDLSQVIKTLKSSSPSTFDFTLTEKDQALISYKHKLVSEQEMFMKNVTLRSNLLGEILDLRLKKVPNLCIQANRKCKAKIESNYLKTKIAEYKTKLDIFMEVPRAIEAYQELLKDIKQQQKECELLIEDMKENKIKYDEVSGKEYNEILKSYLMYKNSIDKLNKMYAIVK